MCINNVDFDGTIITGELVNEPKRLTNIEKGDIVSKKVSDIMDWMIFFIGKTYGRFTIQVVRSKMNDTERRNLDKEWGLDFGDYNEVLLAYEQKKYPENLIEHPLRKNMADRTRKFLREKPSELKTIDENGLSILHQEAIAGNKTNIEILLKSDPNPIV